MTRSRPEARVSNRALAAATVGALVTVAGLVLLGQGLARGSHSLVVAGKVVLLAVTIVGGAVLFIAARRALRQL